MQYVLKHIKYLFLLVIVLVIIFYATLGPGSYDKNIENPDMSYAKVFDGTLKTITFNAALLDIHVIGRSLYKPTAFINQRVQLIPQQLLARDADVIALQEVYEKKHIDYFIDKLRPTYPYYFFKHNSQIKLNNGLMIFSKYPFISTKGESQTEKGSIDEWLIADRGLISATIRVNESIDINIVNLHTTSDSNSKDQDKNSTGLKQDAQIKQALALALSGNTVYQIIVGDINAGPNIAAMKYKYLLEQDFVDTYAEYSKQTGVETKPTWESTNPLNVMRNYNKNMAQRIDHLYLSKALMRISEINKVERIFDKNIVTSNSQSFPLSDHYGLELELIFREKDIKALDQ